jgi:hypothetical protein
VVVSLPNVYVRVTIASWTRKQTPTQLILARLVHTNQTKSMCNGSLAMAGHGLADWPAPMTMKSNKPRARAVGVSRGSVGRTKAGTLTYWRMEWSCCFRRGTGASLK